MKDIKRTLSEYLYAFKASGNPNRWDPSNVAFYYDLREQLENDDEYQEEPTVDRFVFCLEKTATQWERDEFRVAERSKKRARTSFSSFAPDRNSHSAGYDKGKSSKKTESSSASQINALPQVTTVTGHCDGCGKLDHKRDECKSNGSHPDFNKNGPWIECSSYKKIADQYHVTPTSHVTQQLPRWILNHDRPAQASSGSSRYLRTQKVHNPP